MKTFLLLAFTFATVLAPVANAAKAEDQDQLKHPKKQQHAPAVIQQAPKAPHHNTVRQQVPVSRAPQVKPVITNQTPRVRPFDQDVARTYRPNRNPDPMPRIRPNQNVAKIPQTTTTVSPNVNPRNRSDLDNRNRTDRNNWQNNRVTTNNQSWEEARRRHHRNHHDRSWWRSRYNRFALFGAGYYFWDSGYWYPAYGYDSRYNSYSYDEPIYGYNDLDPAQVISTVQTELQRLGYYRYAVDGQMGPATRAAIANYQRDTGLSITAAIDEPTLQSLGLD
jgi:Ni/Co efflux regulator RcnB